MLGLIAQYSQWRIGTHGADGLFAIQRHGGDECIEVFGGITECFLVFEHLVMLEVGKHDPGLGQFIEPDLVFIEPFGIRLL